MKKNAVFSIIPAALALAVLTTAIKSDNAYAKDVFVSPSDFSRILLSVGPGSKVVFRAGRYSPILIANLNFSPAITLDLSLASIVQTRNSVRVAVRNSSGIRITGLTATGDGSVAEGTGVRVNNSHNILIEDSHFKSLKRGVIFDHVSQAIIKNASFEAMTSDAINLIGVQTVTLDSIRCFGSAALGGYHPDCVQLWTWKGAGPSRDIVIKNLSISGATQGIFLIDHDGVGLENVVISDTTIRVDYPNALVLKNCVRCSVSRVRIERSGNARFPVGMRVYGGSVKYPGVVGRVVLDGRVVSK